MHKFPYKVVPDAEFGTAVEVDGEVKSLINVSSSILKHLKGMAERNVGQEVVRAVVTVPAYYNDNQRHAVKRAGQLAGLQVERIVDEPTAAAIAFGLSQTETDMRILVYDLGGGTFDVSILHMYNGKFKVIATAGDNFLGGEDFDNRIVDYVIEAYEEGYNQSIWSSHPGVRVRLKLAAEKAKIALTNEDMARIDLPNVPLTTRGTCHVIVNLTRSRLVQLVDRFIDRSIFLADVALREAKLSKDDLDAVLLVGGQTQMPHVRSRLAKHFGDLVRHDIDPSNAVAMGAALLAQSVEQGLPEVSLQAVLPMTIGLSAPSNPVFNPVIARNTSLPHRQSFPVSVPQSLWQTFTHDVFQGDSKDIRENEYLGTLQVYDLEPGPEDPVQLNIEFALTKECLLQVFVTNAATGMREEVMLVTKEESPSIAALNASGGTATAPTT
jgi:molecular chaperone DnaK